MLHLHFRDKYLKGTVLKLIIAQFLCLTVNNRMTAFYPPWINFWKRFD